MKNLLLLLLRAYQSLPLPTKGSCRFVPTCSEYCYQALVAHGKIKGILLCAKRVLSCNPLFPRKRKLISN